jgi:hypothetical protein
VGKAFLQGVTTGVDDVIWSVEIGFADLEVDDIVPLGFEGTSLYENLEGGFSAQARHAPGKTEFAWKRLVHGSEFTVRKLKPLSNLKLQMEATLRTVSLKVTTAGWEAAVPHSANLVAHQPTAFG